MAASWIGSGQDPAQTSTSSTNGTVIGWLKAIWSKSVVSAVFQGTLTDHSGTLSAATTSQQVMASNTSRRYLYVQNPSSTDTLWINFTTDATQAEPSIQMLPGGSFVMEGSFVSTEAVNIIGPTAGDAFVAKEG